MNKFATSFQSPSRGAILYANMAAVQGLGMLFALLGLSLFAAGIVAIYILKFHKPRIDERGGLAAAWRCTIIALTATTAVLAGSVVGLGVSQSKLAPDVLILQYALPFFIEIFLSLFLAWFIVHAFSPS